MAKRSSKARRARAAEPEEADLKLEIPLPVDDEIGSEKYWIDQIDQAETRLKKEIKDWRGNLARYAGARPKLTGLPDDETINVNVQFYTTEQKIPQLFFQTPHLQVTTRQESVRAATPLVKAILNERLGEEFIDVQELMEEVLRDVLVPAGIGPTKIGYDRVTVDIDQPVYGPDPLNPQGPPIQQYGEDGKPLMQKAKKLVYEDYYWRRISPADFRVPRTFRSTRFDEAPWLGFEFDFTDAALEEYGLDPKSGQQADNELSLAIEHDSPDQGEDLATGPRAIEIWYRASIYDPNEINPEKIRQLVIAKGKGRGGRNASRVVVHRDSPYQRFDEAGKFVSGMRGFPIHVCAIRKQPDTAYPKSDCRVLRDVADEKCLGRSQMIQQRRRNLPLRGFNKKRVDLDTVQRIERGQIQGLIGFDGPITPDMFAELAKAAFPHENMIFDRIAQQDVDRLAASGANQQGIGEDDADTATEANIISRAIETRLSKERERVVSFYTKGVAKLFALFQLFADADQIVEMEGEDGAQQLMTWNKDRIQGRFAFKAIPDSAVRNDANVMRQIWLRLYNLVANDPLAQQKRSYLLSVGLELFGYDPSKVIGQPPQKGPEQPKATISISVKGAADLNDPAMRELLTKSGIQLQTPIQPQAPGLEHGGAARQASQLDKHEADRSGGMSGPPTVPA